MFQGCFSYDKKGPFYIQSPKTKKEKEEAQKVVDKINEELEPILREEQELETKIKRLGLRRIRGPKPKQRF